MHALAPSSASADLGTSPAGSKGGVGATMVFPDPPLLCPMPMNGPLSIALLILVLAVVGVALFFVVMGLLSSVSWVVQRCTPCPHCARRGGVRNRNFWRESRMTPEGVRYPGYTCLDHCERCDWFIVRDSETGTRCIGPDEEEWQEWRGQFHR